MMTDSFRLFHVIFRTFMQEDASIYLLLKYTIEVSFTYVSKYVK